MMPNDLLKIGQMAKMYGISMGTLRYYEKEGLIQPEYIDAHTGYRYYGVKQMEILNTIRYLRQLDMPMDQIKTFVLHRNVDTIEKQLREQKALIAKKQNQLDRMAQQIDHRLARLMDAQKEPLEKIQEKQYPPLRMVCLKEEVKPSSYLDLEYAIRQLEKDQKETFAFLGKVGIGLSKEKLQSHKWDTYDRVFLLLDAEDDFQGQVDVYPSMKCVSIRFQGSHAQAAQYYERLFAYMQKKQYVIQDFSREITLIDNGLTNDTSQFVTEISIPIS